MDANLLKSTDTPNPPPDYQCLIITAPPYPQDITFILDRAKALSALGYAVEVIQPQRNR